MSSVEVRIPIGISGALFQAVREPGLREPVAFAFGRHARIGNRTVILVREFTLPGESAFLPSNGHGARWRGAYTVELLNRAIELDCGLFIIHAHGGTAPVQLSADDRSSGGELLPKFQLVIPDRPHGSIVIGETSAAGLILLPDEEKPVEQFTLRRFDHGIETWPYPAVPADDELIFRKQRLPRTAFASAILSGATVAVVGVSGGGTQVIPQLAALGVGEIIAIDDQTADDSNRAATPNLGWLDVLLRFRKTAASRLRVWLTDRRVRFTPVNARVPEPAAVEALKRADLIIGCVNNLHARADMNEIAWRYCVPYIDIGLVLGTDDNASAEPKPLNAIAGNIFVAVPGGPCLWCSGFVSQAKLDAETDGRGRPYLRAAHGRDAFVAAFNGTLANEAAADVLRLLLGFRPSDADARRNYDGISGTLTECMVKRRSDCVLCQRSLAAGDIVWKSKAA